MKDHLNRAIIRTSRQARSRATLLSVATLLVVPPPPASPPRPAPPPPNSPFRNCRATLKAPPSSRFALFLPPLPAPPSPPRSSSTPTEAFAALTWGVPPVPMNAATMVAGSMGPLPWVRPSGPTWPDRISRSRMMAVSACEPQRLLEQSRGVPSATVGGRGLVRRFMVGGRDWGGGALKVGGRRGVDAIHTGETGHVDAVGASDEGDYAMGGGRGGEEGEEEDLVGMHFDLGG